MSGLDLAERINLATLEDEEAKDAAAPTRVEAGRRTRFTRWTIFQYALLGLGAAAMLLPFLDLLLGALRTVPERLARPQVYWPRDPQWQNFATVFRDYPLALWIFNSTVVTTAITVAQLATSATAGYALAKFDFPGRAFLLRFVIAAQLFPLFLLIVPLFFILRYWPLAGGNDLLGQGGRGLLGTYAALVLPFTVSWYGIFLMRQFLIGVPDEMIDAARMDGAGELRIFWSIVLPQVRPALATLAVFVFVYHWNEVVWTVTITRSTPELQTAPIGIHLLRGSFDTERQHSLQQAAILLTIAPVALLFLTLQRFYVRSLSGGLGGR